jgi:hypothetical protein
MNHQWRSRDISDEHAHYFAMQLKLSVGQLANVLLVELQGSLNIQVSSKEFPAHLGELDLETDTLYIGHSVLKGKRSELKKPLLVASKHQEGLVIDNIIRHKILYF